MVDTVQRYDNGVPAGTYVDFPTAYAALPVPWIANYTLEDIPPAGPGVNTHTLGMTLNHDPTAANFSLTICGNGVAGKEPTIHVDTVAGYAFQLALAANPGLVTFQYLNFDGWNPGQYAVWNNSTQADFRIYDCDFHGNGLPGLNAIAINSIVTWIDADIQRCTFHGSGGHQFKPWWFTNAGSITITDCVIGDEVEYLQESQCALRNAAGTWFLVARNTFTRTGNLLLYVNHAGANGYVYSNVFDRYYFAAGVGASVDQVSGNGPLYVYFNTFVLIATAASLADRVGIRRRAATGQLWAKGNVFSLEAEAGRTVWGVSGDAAGWDVASHLDYNDYYQQGGAGNEYLGWDADTAASYGTLAGWQGVEQNEQDANAIDTDPQFDNYAGHDLHIPVGSPCNDAAIDLGVAYDRDNAARGPAPDFDIGAYQAPLAQAITDAGGIAAPADALGAPQVNLAIAGVGGIAALPDTGVFDAFGVVVSTPLAFQLSPDRGPWTGGGQIVFCGLSVLDSTARDDTFLSPYAPDPAAWTAVGTVLADVGRGVRLEGAGVGAGAEVRLDHTAAWYDFDVRLEVARAAPAGTAASDLVALELVVGAAVLRVRLRRAAAGGGGSASLRLVVAEAEAPAGAASSGPIGPDGRGWAEDAAGRILHLVRSGAGAAASSTVWAFLDERVLLEAVSFPAGAGTLRIASRNARSLVRNFSVRSGATLDGRLISDASASGRRLAGTVPTAASAARIGAVGAALFGLSGYVSRDGCYEYVPAGRLTTGSLTFVGDPQVKE